jgi:cysteine desulfurase
VKKGVRLNKIIQGAGQESGRRPGTENMLGIAGLGKACEIAGRDFQVNHQHLKTLRNRLYYGLKEKLQDDMLLNGDLDHTLPNTLNISFRGIIANELVMALHENLVISAGAACHSGITRVSEVLQAMKIPEEWARGAVRISVGKFTTLPEIDKAIELMAGYLVQ